MEAAITAMRRAGGFWEDPERALEAAWPHVRAWWLMGLGLAPVAAVIFDLFRPGTVEELRDRDERRTDRQRNRRERRARKAAGAPKPERRPAGFELGPPRRRGPAAAHPPRPRLDAAGSAGEDGAGYRGARVGQDRDAAAPGPRRRPQSDWCVFVIDAKGDPHTQSRFADLMHQAGREPRLFPSAGYDGWRGDGREIAGRLVQLIDWADEGGGTYYRDLSVNLVRAACQAPNGPPRSSGRAAPAA